MKDPNEAVNVINEANRLYEYVGGMLIWKISKPPRATAGKRAGTVLLSGYRCVKVLGKQMLEHRVIFLMKNGYSPEFIDHINGDRADNRIENLRAASRRQNNCNSAIRSNNTSGVKGVYFNKRTGKWVARVFRKGNACASKSFHLLEDAANFRYEMERIEYGEFACQR